MSKRTSNMCLILSFVATMSFTYATGKFSVGLGTYMLCVLFYNVMDEVCEAIRASK